MHYFTIPNNNEQIETHIMCIYRKFVKTVLWYVSIRRSSGLAITLLRVRGGMLAAFRKNVFFL